MHDDDDAVGLLRDQGERRQRRPNVLVIACADASVYVRIDRVDEEASDVVRADLTLDLSRVSRKREDRAVASTQEPDALHVRAHCGESGALNAETVLVTEERDVRPLPAATTVRELTCEPDRQHSLPDLRIGRDHSKRAEGNEARPQPSHSLSFDFARPHDLGATVTVAVERYSVELIGVTPEHRREVGDLVQLVRHRRQLLADELDAQPTRVHRFPPLDQVVERLVGLLPRDLRELVHDDGHAWDTTVLLRVHRDELQDLGEVLVNQFVRRHTCREDLIESATGPDDLRDERAISVHYSSPSGLLR